MLSASRKKELDSDMNSAVNLIENHIAVKFLMKSR